MISNAKATFFKPSEIEELEREDKSIKEEADKIKNFLDQKPTFDLMTKAFLNAIFEKNVPFVRELLKKNYRLAHVGVWTYLIDVGVRLKPGVKPVQHFVSVYQYLHLYAAKEASEGRETSKESELTQLIYKYIGIENAQKQMVELSKMDITGQSTLVNRLKIIIEQGALAQAVLQEAQDKKHPPKTPQP